MKDQNNPPQSEETDAMSPAQSRPSIRIDYARYDHYLQDAGLTDQQKQEFLDTLWNIIVSFVDLGFGVHPIQQVDGHESDPIQILAQSAFNVVEGKNTKSTGENTSKEKEENCT